MKNEKEFIATMWQTVSNIEFEEQQKQIARQKSAEITKRTVLIYSSLFTIFVGLILAFTFLPLTISYTYIICLVSIVCGYLIDGFSFARNINRRDYLENRN